MARRRRLRRLLRTVLLALLVLLVVAPAGLLLVYRVLPVPATPLMVIRLVEGHGWRRDWVPLNAVAAAVPRAVIAAEDNRFCSHDGFDWIELEAAYADWQAGRRLRGASTISMQVAKNLFLWEDRTFFRKGLEAWLTLFVEALLPKRRIMEIYLNIAETGPGRYGVAAAAEAEFGLDPASLSRRQAALIAATLPNPLGRSAGAPSGGVADYARTIDRRVDALGPSFFACLE